jgi:hypothetical protein
MDDTHNFNLNIVGVRSADNQVNVFNDWMTVFWNYSGHWNFLAFQCTTDPGIYWLNNPMNPDGTAILVPDRYPGMWSLGKHRGKYPALVQAKSCEVVRDYNRDKNLNFNSGVREKGLFGINCHRANEKNRSIQVDKWSAGCQVFSDPDDYRIFLAICQKSVENWGNSFTYILLDEREFS